MSEVSIVVLASGRGSNFISVAGALREGRIGNARLAALITDRTGTGAGEFAEANRIPVRVLPYKDYDDRASFDAALDLLLAELAPDLILTLGYMRIINAKTVQAYQGRIINIHPSILPSFPGMHAQRQAWQYGVKVTGATVHFMDEGVDTGPIIQQKSVTVPEGITEEGLSDLILKVEHEILPQAVDLFCQGRLRLEGRKVVILDQ